jgi:hypothetical protein
MICGHGTHENGIGALAHTRQRRGVRGVGLYRPHIPQHVRTDTSAGQDDIMAFLAKKASRLATNRARADNNIRTHRNLSSVFKGEAGVQVRGVENRAGIAKS